RLFSPAPHAFIAVAEPVRRGRVAERYELRDGDCGGSDCTAPRARAEVVQDYDTGAFGRFGRQAYAAIMALNNPLGQGPEEFGHYRIGEDPHNTYLKVFLAYGWVGGAALIWLIAVTVWRGVKSLALPSPNRLALIPVVATFIPMAIEAAIIDVDHWRHFFLLIGLIWGITAAYDRMPAPRERAALP
ncbi:MAG: hypothetical protein WD230_07865, partial [Cucumibacter sp.]